MPRVFDEKELLERIDNDWDFLADTVQMLQSDGRALLEEIQRASGAGDAPAVGRAAHTLKGMISNFCAQGAQANAFEVEKIGKSGDLSNAPAAIEVLHDAVEGLIKELNEFLATRM
jgi:protein-histidine pros-kinase